MNFLEQLIVNHEIRKLKLMNQKQIVNLLAPAIATGTAVLATKLGIDPQSWLADITEWLGAIISVSLVIYGHFSHATPTNTTTVIKP